MHLACAFGKMFVFKTSNDVISRPPPTPPSRDLTMLTTPMCGEHGRITGLRHGRMRRKSLLLCTKLPWMGGTDTERRLDGRNGYGEMGGTNTGRRGNLGQRQLFELHQSSDAEKPGCYDATAPLSVLLTTRPLLLRDTFFFFEPFFHLDLDPRCVVRPICCCNRPRNIDLILSRLTQPSLMRILGRI